MKEGGGIAGKGGRNFADRTPFRIGCRETIVLVKRGLMKLFGYIIVGVVCCSALAFVQAETVDVIFGRGCWTTGRIVPLGHMLLFDNGDAIRGNTGGSRVVAITRPQLLFALEAAKAKRVLLRVHGVFRHLSPAEQAYSPKGAPNTALIIDKLHLPSERDTY
jgi:hypothetical protein